MNCQVWGLKMVYVGIGGIMRLTTGIYLGLVYLFRWRIEDEKEPMTSRYPWH